MAENNHVNENKYKRHQLFTIDAEAVRVLHSFLIFRILSKLSDIWLYPAPNDPSLH